MSTFTIREGDGNDGCYRRGTVIADNAYEALRKASRQKMIFVPNGVRITKDIEGDNEQAYVMKLVNGFDYAVWVAEAHLVKDL